MSFRLQIRRLANWVVLVGSALLIMAAGAHADGEWKIAEQTMTSLEASEASISGVASESIKLSVAWYASEIECSTLATEAPTKIFKAGTSEAILQLSSCQLLGPPFVSETCKLIEPTELRVVGELLLHSGKTYELFEAPSGKTSLGTIAFKEGTECPLPSVNELKGTLVGETEAGERKEQPLAFSSTIESLFGSDSLSFGSHPATLKGKSVWALAAGYKGLSWAAIGEESKSEEEGKLQEEKELEEEKLEKEKLEEEKELEELELCVRKSSEPGWYVCGIPLKGSEKVKGAGTSFVLSVPGLGISPFKCSSESFSGTLEAGGALTGTLSVSSCAEEKFCKPATPAVFSVKGNLALGGGETFVLFSGNPLGLFKFGGLCALPKEITLIGSFVAKCQKCNTELVTQSLNLVNTGSLPEDKILWPASWPTVIEGNLSLELDGESTGEAWGGKAE